MSFKQVTAYLEKNSLRLFYMFLGAAVLLRLLDDVLLGRWGIHAGAIFPYRHPGYFPLYGTTGLLLEWALALTGGVLLFTNEKRKGAFFAAIAMSLSLSQMMQNQKILLWIVLWIVALTDLGKNIPARKFLKWQIVLVYTFGALSKIFDQFVTGETLHIIALRQMETTTGLQKFLWSPLLNSGFSTMVSYAVIALELLIPLLFIRKKEWAWFFVLVLHGGFVVMMKDLSSFTFSMFALASLYYCPDVMMTDEDLIQPVNEPG
ncbi:hypothetical protein [Bdellovibrio svalbardensis]|uniref:HTTM domain-containing protein n=1 Tax=Bdellovibrio svalbardensis TaxID=2972972 RepID=A0ABT6DI86_9BACT|nr:hypothetical protein [Bdellovibrio svalbardensis]MDG0814818.1 hypothetical protein [Bdellovibrio svalbardensis]